MISKESCFEEEPHDIENGRKFSQELVEDEHTLLAKCGAEVFGTFVLVAFGTGVVAQSVLTGGSDSTAIHLTWGLAVTFGVIVSHRISGAHLNPSVTLAVTVIGGLPWKHVIPYWISQLLGAFLGAAWTYLSYFNAFNINETATSDYPFGKTLATNIFCTSPGPNVTNTGAFFCEVLGTALLLIGILAITDKKQKHAASIWHVAGFVGLLVVAIGMAFGANSGYAINPARDLGPRIFMSIAGWGSEVFTTSNYYFVVPIFGPFIGAVVGACITNFTILRV